MEYGQLQHLLAPLNLHPLTPLDSEQRWTALFSILANREAREMILNNAKSLRLEVIRYFEEAGIFDGVKFGLVDVGWYMTCQSAMRQILESVGNFNLDVGLYLGLAVERLPPSRAGSSEALFNTPAADIRNTFSPFHLESNRAGLLEHIVGLAEHPSTIGYASGKPVFAASRISQDFLNTIHAIHAAVEDYCLGANLKTLGDDWSTGNCRQLLFPLISGFFTNPNAEILKHIQPLEISVNQEGVGNQPLFKPLRIRDLILYFKRGNSFLAKSDWPEADLVVTTPLLRKTFEFSKTASSALKSMLRSDNRPAP
jgi:hypothetical protein